MPPRLILLFAGLLVMASGCRQPEPRERADDLSIVGSSDIPPHSDWNDRALLIAGMPVSAAYAARPEVAAILARPSYRSHSQMMDGLWKSIEDRRVNRIRPWREKYVEKRIRVKTALYPLSGGDFLNLNLMFPDAERYVMIAMEKPGQMPDASALSEAQLRGGLASVGQMLANIAQTGYFWSHFMNTHMNPESKGIYGTMPTVSVFLVRLGHVIQDVQEACITDGGHLDVRGHGIAGACRVRGYRIRFRDGRNGAAKELLYLSARIDDALFAPQTPEGRFFRGIRHAGIMLKAAVYLLHSPRNQGAVDYLARTADVVLQDDSGLPFRTFESTQWDVELYGTFIGPPRLSDLEYYPQPDLARAFKERAGELPFDFGYGQIEPTKRSGVLVAFRK